jgi:small subunit ribosomal protein S17
MPKRILKGVVLSDSMDKTITVLVERKIKHPLYNKFIRKTKKYHAHDELEVSAVGDVVSIIECAPLSKTKSWKLLNRNGVSS